MDEALGILAREFPDRTPTGVTPASRGHSKRTSFVSFDAAEAVVVQCSQNPAALRTERELARAVRARTSIPVPRVLAGGDRDGTGYAVFERAPGDDLHERFTTLDDATRRDVVRTFGRVLGELHDAFEFDAFGTVRVEPGSSGGFRATESTDWPTWFRSHAREGVAALTDAFADLRAPIREAFETASLPDRPPARLFPWDLRPGNALVDDGSVSAFVDWGDPLAAAPGLAVAKAEHLTADWYVDAPDRRPLRAAFREGYESVRPYPAVPDVYRLAAVVDAAVDSRGVVTRPGYPERRGEAAVAFHRERLRALL
jgi:Ser/Thr protein kinase RdoA (MazF antagonist)